MQAYNHADSRIHLLAQIIAKLNRTYIPKKPDDSHTNLSFDPIHQRLYGRWIASSGGKIICCLNLARASYEWLNDGFGLIAELPFGGKNLEVLEVEMEKILKDLDINPEGFRQKLHFQITEYPFAQDPIENFTQDQISTWTSYRQLANLACSEVLGLLQTEGEIRIWPHHFDTGIYVEINPRLGVGFGLAMEDSLLNAPYFYLAVYGLGGKTLSYDELPDLKYGKWLITEHWKGAALSLDALSALGFEALRQVQLFSRQSLEGFLGQEL